MRWLFRTGTGAYHQAIRLAARLGNGRAREWTAGRAAIPEDAIRQLQSAGREMLWVHAASLGEFEQARPVLTELRRTHPEYAVVLTFFSPSGYRRSKETELADVVSYLPADGPRSARRWLDLLRPAAAVFVKYEFWYDHLAALRAAGIPTILIAATFRPEQPFFRWYGGVWREMLECFTHVAVQTEHDASLLASVGYDRVFVTGDPRLDRTAELAATDFHDDRLAKFSAGRPTLFAGSVWPQDVAIIAEVWDAFRDRWNLVLAPHQLDPAELDRWQTTFGAQRYTGAADDRPVLLLDTYGILSRSYRYGTAAYVGGAFGSGLHNTLEPMSYGLPVIFGPRYGKFPEARAALAAGGAFTVRNAGELKEVWERLSDPACRETASGTQRAYLERHRGAGKRTADLIGRYLVLLLLLTGRLSGQAWEPAERLIGALDGTVAKCNLMEALAAVAWRPGLCMAVVELDRGATASLQLELDAGSRYLIIASGEGKGNDIDLYLRDGGGKLVSSDDQPDGTPVVEYTPAAAGPFVVQVHLPDAGDSTRFVSLGILVDRGVTLADEEYRKVSRQFGAAAGAVRAAGGATRFGSGRNQWCVYGYFLREGEGATLDNVTLPAGRNFLAATGSEGIRNLDIYLADEAYTILRRDRDPDPYPMVEFDNPTERRVMIRLEVEAAMLDSLVLLGLFTR